ncbi:surface lipoprotein assembly modifier [Lysobacter sp. CA199]|uniref:surface lipoprotein assembly modifier n=1 Tax=Lysobacter sp. CA199 TaxID=3455608 RepID=UPI003F8D000A
MNRPRKSPLFPRRWAIGLSLCSLLCAGASAWAQDRDDTRLRLDHGLEQRQNERERKLLEEENRDAAMPVDAASTDAAAVDVGTLSLTLYQAVEARQWPLAKRLLAQYRSLPDRDPMLELYALGALARADGDLSQAERHYRALLDRQADFLPGRLELARVLFENQLDREAEQRFRAIEDSLDPADSKTEGVRRTVATFLRALANRRGWHGSVAVGPTWNDNLNQSSESRTCLLAAPDGLCVIERSLPKAARSAGLDFDASLSRRVALRGHHGVFVRSLVYGYAYRDDSRYNESTWINSAGYSYASARHSYSLAPTFEYGAYGNQALYGAWGLRADWSYTFSPRWMFKLEGDYKRMRYRRSVLSHFDGDIASIYATVWRALPRQWLVFGGLDLSQRDGRRESESYLQRGVRLGVSKQFDAGFGLLAFASLRRRDHDAFNDTLQARRHDDEQNYTVIVRMPKFAFAGLTPSLTLKHNTIASSVDWLYSYDRNSVSLKLERSF